MKWFKKLFKMLTMQDYINSAKAHSHVEDEVSPEPPKMHVTTLTISTKDRTLSKMTCKFSIDSDKEIVKDAFNEFEDWWLNRTSPSYIFVYDTGKTMILRENIKAYELRFEFAETE